MNTNTSHVILNTKEDNVSVSNLTESANDSITTPSRYAPYEYYITASDDFHFYAVSVIIPFGLVGNIFSICVFLLSSVLRHTTTGQYLVALAIADSIVLVGEMLRLLSYHTEINPHYYLSSSFGLNIFHTSSAVCKTTNFLRYGGGLWSAWITVAIAVERLLAVAFPLKIGRISTLRTSRTIILTIAIISVSLALFSFWHFEIRLSDGGAPQCKIWGDGYHTWNTVTLKFGTLIIPGVLIAILTIIIIVLLYRARNQRKSQVAVPERRLRKGDSHLELSTETQLTIMLLTVCIATTALRAPYTIAYYFRTKCWMENSCDNVHNFIIYVAYRVGDVFNIVNYAINFILYCLSGSSFREQVKKTICRGTKARSSSDIRQVSLEPSPVGSKSHLLKHASKTSPLL